MDSRAILDVAAEGKIRITKEYRFLVSFPYKER
jgi:hypothetical protein